MFYRLFFLFESYGYRRKNEKLFPAPNFGYIFILDRVEEFLRYKDPKVDDNYLVTIIHKQTEAMKNLHIWVGNFKNENEFENFLDQKKYLEAWAVYDNESPTGNEKQDAEPSTELRCNFCKEINIDTYDRINSLEVL
jgi:hypothetical protein